MSRKPSLEFDARTEEIAQGSRNSTMSHIAGRLIKRYGNTDEAHELFLKAAEKCNPPLSDSELSKIWSSVGKFGTKVSSQEGYIPPEIYNSDCVLKSTDYLVYNGSFWEESSPKSQGISQELTERQLEEAEADIKKAMDEMVKNGAFEILAAMGPKKAEAAFNRIQAHSFEMYEAAQNYKKYVIKRRDSKYIASTLKEGRPMLEVEQTILDADEFLLNCPSGTVDLRKGAGSMEEHNPENFITKQTAVDPGSDGADIWKDALDTFFQNDADLIEYVQKIVGLSAIGKVYTLFFAGL